MQVCKTREMRLDRGALGLKPSALVAVAGEGPEGRKAPRSVFAALYGCIHCVVGTWSCECNGTQECFYAHSELCFVDGAHSLA